MNYIFRFWRRILIYVNLNKIQLLLVREQIWEGRVLVHLPFLTFLFPGLQAEKLEWGNCDQLNHILDENPGGFDLVLGADIYIRNIF